MSFFSASFPRVGTYPVVATSRAGVSSTSWNATYSLTDSGYQAFDADLGAVEVSHADGERVDLVIRMWGSQFCMMLPGKPPEGSCDPASAQRLSKTVGIVGKISALRGEFVDQR